MQLAALAAIANDGSELNDATAGAALAELVLIATTAASLGTGITTQASSAFGDTLDAVLHAGLLGSDDTLAASTKERFRSNRRRRLMSDGDEGGLQAAGAPELVLVDNCSRALDAACAVLLQGTFVGMNAQTLEREHFELSCLRRTPQALGLTLSEEDRLSSVPAGVGVEFAFNVSGLVVGGIGGPQLDVRHTRFPALDLFASTNGTVNSGTTTVALFDGGGTPLAMRSALDAFSGIAPPLAYITIPAATPYNLSAQRHHGVCAEADAGAGVVLSYKCAEPTSTIRWECDSTAIGVPQNVSYSVELTCPLVGPSCLRWDWGAAEWSPDEGCTVMSYDEVGMVTCGCSHLEAGGSHFALGSNITRGTTYAVAMQPPTPAPTATPTSAPTAAPVVSAAPTPPAISISATLSMSGFACSEFGTEEESAIQLAVASSHSVIETSHLSAIECADTDRRRAVRRRRLAGTTDETDLSYDITIPWSVVDDDDPHSAVADELASAYSSGAFMAALLEHASNSSVLQGATTTGLAVVINDGGDDAAGGSEGEGSSGKSDDDGLNAASAWAIFAVGLFLAAVVAAVLYQRFRTRKSDSPDSEKSASEQLRATQSQKSTPIHGGLQASVAVPAAEEPAVLVIAAATTTTTTDITTTTTATTTTTITEEPAVLVIDQGQLRDDTPTTVPPASDERGEESKYAISPDASINHSNIELDDVGTCGGALAFVSCATSTAEI